MSCRAPSCRSEPLDPLIDVWPKDRPIHVIHDAAFAPHSFNPGVDTQGRVRKPTRFAPITDCHGHVVPYLYGGQSLACAIFETVFHDVPIDAADKYVDLDGFAQRGHGLLSLTRDLHLADLTSEGLHRLKVPKNELIASPSRAYPQTLLWAQALHRQCPQIDGLVWMSRQRDRDLALVLFGDRAADAVSSERIGGPLARNPALYEHILVVALRAGIDVS